MLFPCLTLFLGRRLTEVPDLSSFQYWLLFCLLLHPLLDVSQLKPNTSNFLGPFTQQSQDTANENKLYFGIKVFEIQGEA